MKKKRKSARFRKLQDDLRYYQTMYRVELFTLKLGREKIREIGKKMQEEIENG